MNAFPTSVNADPNITEEEYLRGIQMVKSEISTLTKELKGLEENLIRLYIRKGEYDKLYIKEV